MSRSDVRRQNDEKIIKRRLRNIPSNLKAYEFDELYYHPGKLRDTSRFYRRCHCPYCDSNRPYNRDKNRKEPRIQDYE